MFKVDKENQNKFPCQGKNSFTYDKLFLCKQLLYIVYFIVVQATWKVVENPNYFD